MKIYCLLPAIVLMTSGCGLFKRTTKTLSKTHQTAQRSTRLESTEEINTVVDSKRIRFQKDSVQTGYSIQFWPKGKLTFLPDGGFSGEFDSVLWKGNFMKTSRSAEIMTAIGQQKLNLKTAKETSQHSSFDQSNLVKQSLPEWKMVIIGLAVAILLLIYWVKR